MKYIAVDKKTLAKYNFPKTLRRTNGTIIIVNEIEILSNKLLDGDITQRIAKLGGKIISQREIIKLINTNKLIWGNK